MTEQKNYRVMLPDAFYDTVAASEEEAIAKATTLVMFDAQSGGLGLIAWETAKQIKHREDD
jgi:hypothetical protein